MNFDKDRACRQHGYSPERAVDGCSVPSDSCPAKRQIIDRYGSLGMYRLHLLHNKGLLKMSIMTTTTTTVTRRLEIPAATIEDIVKAWLSREKNIPLGQVTEVEWDASSEGLVRGLTVVTRETTEETL